ncbi:MAG TPA: Imm1 family immunity protein [Actinophytocola sp.]|uniref:Imm1 family immunity protein n=1 Tax=Actinophytocola sp. TaxID=1872138 RepID=UPI002DDCBB70|nr:Imm1 family immunity protein [Actinophytocola sp.]HEV2782124.1 Imm1 family immunity protein [Actinophytocola sp.]
MTAMVERAATMLGGDTYRREVFAAHEFDRLVDAALVDGGGVAQRVVWAQAIPDPYPRGWVPETVLVVTVRESWGALYYRGNDHRAWITENPQPSPDAPVLIFDDQAPADFPADAVLPVDQIRAAVEEYVHTGERPTCVRWREPDRYMTW